MSRPHDLSRRTLFGLAGSALAAPMNVRLQTAMATDRGASNSFEIPTTPAGPTLDVAGPRDGQLAAWAKRLQAPLAAGLMNGNRLGLRFGGGVDGVTGANQFDARSMPDGQTALLFPGSVALAWLAGERRVQLDPGHMLPLFAALGSGVLMVRGAWPPPIGTDRPGGTRQAVSPLRLAMGQGPDAGLVALLGLDLLGIPAIAVAEGTESRSIAPEGDAATRSPQGGADAVFLHGADASARAPGLLAAGYRPRLTTAPTDATNPLHPDLSAPFFLSGLPAARLHQDPLVDAWRAAAAASALCAVLVVPRLSPAASIGQWRRAASSSLANEGVAAQARRQALRLVVGADAVSALAPMRVGGATQLAFRRWLSRRVAWQPG